MLCRRASCPQHLHARWQLLSKEGMLLEVCCLALDLSRAATLTLLLPQREVEPEFGRCERPRRLQGGADFFRWKQNNSPCARLRLHAIRRRTEMHLMHGSVPIHIHVVCRRTEMHLMHGSVPTHIHVVFRRIEMHLMHGNVLTNINAGSEVHLMHGSVLTNIQHVVACSACA